MAIMCNKNGAFLDGKNLASFSKEKFLTLFLRMIFLVAPNAPRVYEKGFDLDGHYRTSLACFFVLLKAFISRLYSRLACCICLAISASARAYSGLLMLLVLVALVLSLMGFFPPALVVGVADLFHFSFQTSISAHLCIQRPK